MGLQFQQGLHHHRRQERRQADAVAVGQVQELGRLHPQAGHMVEAIGLRRAFQPPGVGLLPAGPHGRVVFLKTVLKFRCLRLLPPVQNAVGGRDLDAVFPLQIFCRQGL